MNAIQIIDYILYIFIVFLWISEKGKYYMEIIIIICLGYSVLESVASVPFYNFVLSSVLFRQFFHVGKLSNFIFKTYSRVTTAAICLMPENFFQTKSFTTTIHSNLPYWSHFKTDESIKYVYPSWGLDIYRSVLV